MANSHSETITIVTAVFFSISVVTVMLRCFVRLRLIRAFGWDDAFMVVALVGSSFIVNEKLWYIDLESCVISGLRRLPC